MADIEALMYSYPLQGQAGFSSLISTREEFWPTAYDVTRVASQEVTAAVDPQQVVSGVVAKRSRQRVPSIGGGVPEAEPAAESPPPVEESEGQSPTALVVNALEMTDENISRHAVRVLGERFMLIYDRLFLYYSTGAGKTVISAGIAEPLVRNVAVELVDSYLAPKRTNLRRVIVIVSSDAQKRDFMKKIIETSRRPQYERAVRIGATQPILERLATYAAALSQFYVFHTKTSFIAKVYGTASIYGDVDPTRPDPSGLSFANNSILLIDEIHSFSREESSSMTAAAARRAETVAEEDQFDDEVGGASPRRRDVRQEEDFRYAQYHYVLHAIQGSKVIGLSATPMKDSPQEIAKVMNLILPLDRQIPSGMDVLSRDALTPYLRGYVSYFKTRSTRVMNRGVMLSLDEDSKGSTAEASTSGFETVFPVEMSPLQAKVYKRVISERDSFNRNALRASNIVYPDESAGNAGFLSRFVQSSRGWDGMEPNDEYRTFLRASRENRQMISPKFCAIADLCHISKGVVFVYMRNLKGGLFDLAAFLDAEGFERFTPQATQTLFLPRSDGSHEMLISKRPRYSLVIGETKAVLGRLDGILNLVNVDENADGDFVKIVLGSAAVRESFDIRNSITMIIASPEQTETAMTQALGRIVRPGAQRALLRRNPSLPPIVSVYRMASYLPGTKYEGKDLDTYLDSARKDRRIKVVERMLRDSSIDCRMLHSINYEETDDVVDDSPACLYGPCDYVCDTEEPVVAATTEDPLLDSTSMNALYRTEKFLRLKVELTRAAQRHVYIPISDVDAVVESHALAQRVVETMSVMKEQLRDRYGRQAYVYHDRNGVYFASSPVITGQLGDGSGEMCPVSMSDYEHYVTSSLLTPLDTLSGTSLLLPGTLETILIVTPHRAVTGSVEEDRELLRKFSLYLRREIVSKSELLEHVRVRGEQRAHGLQGQIVYWVDYSGLLYTRGDLRVYEGDEGITSIVNKKSSGQPLQFASDQAAAAGATTEVVGSWGPPGSVLMRTLHRRWRAYLHTLFQPYESRFTFYGIIRPSEPDVLRIARQGRDNTKTTPGRALPSWSGEDLREVLATIFSEGSKVVTQNHRRDAASKLAELAPSEVNNYLIAEFERRGMLLRL